jgi:D-sedoheptulose 7-phosphate isomerase
MTMSAFAARVGEIASLLPRLAEPATDQAVAAALSLLVRATGTSAPILVCGNGGSAADAQHIAGELVGRFLRDRRALNVRALTTDTSVLTAWANDIGYDTVFSRQVEAYAAPGGVLLGISTSGNSANVVLAAQAARAAGMSVIAMTGEGGGKLRDLADVLIAVPSKATPRIQEMHLVVYHYLCEELEKQVG